MTESAVSPKIRAMLQILGRMDFGSEAVATHGERTASSAGHSPRIH